MEHHSSFRNLPLLIFNLAKPLIWTFIFVNSVKKAVSEQWRDIFSIKWEVIERVWSPLIA